MLKIHLIYFRLDYCGIAMLIMGSFVPWLYYGFYCQFQPKLIYLSVVICLGISAIIVSLWDRFSEPRYRPLRAGKTAQTLVLSVFYLEYDKCQSAFCLSTSLSLLLPPSSLSLSSVHTLFLVYGLICAMLLLA